jgi:hypothetical protein
MESIYGPITSVESAIDFCNGNPHDIVNSLQGTIERINQDRCITCNPSYYDLRRDRSFRIFSNSIQATQMKSFIICSKERFVIFDFSDRVFIKNQDVCMSSLLHSDPDCIISAAKKEGYFRTTRYRECWFIRVPEVVEKFNKILDIAVSSKILRDL